jgi:glyoxylate reductase
MGDALQKLGERFPELLIAPFRSVVWMEALPHAEALIVLLSEPLTESDIAAAPNLKVIGTYSVGVNHLPLRVCETKNIAIINTPGVLTQATADLALTLLLAVTRRVAEGEALLRSGQWKGWAPDLLLGMGLGGKTCGIFGSGPIGKAFAKRVWALGMKPLFWDREKFGGSVDFGSGVAPRAGFEDLLDQSSIISLHAPLSPMTHDLLNRPALQRLRKGAVIINTARGGMLDENAAIDLLESGHLGGVGLDVFDSEPLVNPRWLRAPRTVLLPHLGSATQETRAAMAERLCEGIATRLDG